ncbi:MAG TPA: murein biosynthesis integral membrane protein MurJ [Verrucomicrobiota bacterium]|nr:murein biosynthesis integral membrane protein MurJ [Verrucomicrobiota bacterium]
MLKSSGAMAGATLTSRLLGMVREMVYARFMGDTWVAAAFQVAFTIPNLFRRLLGEGALTAAFIPIFKEKEKTAGEAEMWRSANAVLSGLLVASAFIIAAVMLGVSTALAVHTFPQKTDLMLRLLRWMFPYMLLVCLTAAFMGMLNARGHFFIPAMGAAMLNVVMIASVLWLAPRWGETLPEQIFALATGVLVAGVAQGAFQLPSLWREGFRFGWVTPWGNETVRRVVQKMIPGALGVAAFQINVVLVQALGFWLDSTEQPLIAPFNYAVRLMELPQGLFGVSLATFLLPTLSGLAAERKYPEFRATLAHGMGHLVFVNVLMAILLITLAEPIIRLLFERGQFDHGATVRTAFALQCLGASLVAYSLVNVLARAFYALGDTRTPMHISVACLALNLVLSGALILPFRQGGLGLANTVSSAVNAGLLLYALRRKMGRLDMSGLRSTLLPVGAAGAVAVLAVLGGSRLWAAYGEAATIVGKLGAVFVPASMAGVLYWAVAGWAKVPAARELASLVFRRSGDRA